VLPVPTMSMSSGESVNLACRGVLYRHAVDTCAVITIAPTHFAAAARGSVDGMAVLPIGVARRCPANGRSWRGTSARTSVAAAGAARACAGVRPRDDVPRRSSMIGRSFRGPPGEIDDGHALAAGTRRRCAGPSRRPAPGPRWRAAWRRSTACGVLRCWRSDMNASVSVRWRAGGGPRRNYDDMGPRPMLN